VVVIAWQLDNGDTYLLNGAEEGAWTTGLDNRGTITDITINSVVLGLSDNLAITYYTVEGSVVCFTAGTLIRTRTGDVAVDHLRVGNEVLTRDRGYRPIRWIGSCKLDCSDLGADPRLRPIRIRADALGDGLPDRDLLVSPQHRMLIASKIARNMFGSDEVLVAAKQLLPMKGIEIAQDVAEVSYWHFLCDDHEIVIANGALSETLYTGKQALRSVGPEARREIFSLFPELRSPDFQPKGARPFIKGRKARELACRHARKNRPLFSRNAVEGTRSGYATV
jgi:hypothetical protein